MRISCQRLKSWGGDFSVKQNSKLLSYVKYGIFILKPREGDKLPLGFSFALKLLVVLVVGDIDFIANFDGFIGYTANVLLKIFGFAVRMST